ncbi:uncharacterized protein LOC109609186 isoform X2 [Aethina tumida]|uniref:uncharacterized protein LOC109609186 isoform X2 n=1 Tax=Aethina tumida TaxID=116153 RepID=UPI002147F428|nr:uncharacterized protein LOC109609186 isoform X2 [Aethina tumida]
MAYLMPDDVLDTNKCSECLKYLSIRPIKVYPNRQTKCGRCSEEGDNGIVSLYEILVQNAVFRCVNRYEGCNAVFTCEDMRLHEMDCIGGKYLCQLCEFTGTAYEYLQHFKLHHKLYWLDKPTITLCLSQEKEDF